MEAQGSLRKEPDAKLKELFEQANRDPELKRRLLRDPRQVAEQFNVKFSDDEVQQLQKLNALTELSEEIQYGRLFPKPPIFYPIDIWRVQELGEIFSRLIVGPGPGPIFYPASDLGPNTMISTRAYNPGWVSYPGPGDEGGGGGGGGRFGGVIPGPIFYPAGLRNLLTARLAQILQIRQRFNR